MQPGLFFSMPTVIEEAEAHTVMGLYIDDPVMELVCGGYRGPNIFYFQLSQTSAPNLGNLTITSIKDGFGCLLGLLC